MTDAPKHPPIAMITGAARRVGLATSRALARSGFDLLITYLDSQKEAAAAAEELRKLGSQVRLERMNLDDLGEVESTGARLARELPRLDVLVHNASMYRPTPLDLLTANEAMRQYRVNAAAPLLLTKHLAPRLAESDRPGGGAVVCMCDIHALGRPRRGFVAYSMSKAALAEMVQSLARELAPKVRVNGVAPGVVAFADHGPDADPEMQRKYLSRVPLGRAGTPEDAAEVVRWLACDAQYVTGEIVRVDGGRWLG